MNLGLKADTKTLLLTEMKDLNKGNLPQAPLIANTLFLCNNFRSQSIVETIGIGKRLIVM